MDSKLLLTEPDFQAAANLLRCKISNVKAVAEVESAGNGFLSDGRVKILFEGHIFHRYTKGKFDQSNPTISYPKWTKTHYAKGATADIRGDGEWRRMTEAYLLDAKAAKLSASYGKFQVMGFNFGLCGFTDIDTMLEAFSKGEYAQLMAFCEYNIQTGLDDLLRAESWDAYARRYNGPLYQRNDYAGKLFRANRKYQ